MNDGYAEYDALARVYDFQWGFYIERVLPTLNRLVLDDLEHGARILDLCCGTGVLAHRLTERGFAVTGLDSSDEMLRIARRAKSPAQFLLADARRFAVDSPVDCVVSTFDSLNHVLSLEELGQVFVNVFDSLLPGGRFVFDLNLRHGFLARWQGEGSVVEEEFAMFSRNSFDEAAGLGRVVVTLFERTPDGWDRSDTTFVQRCYSESEVLSALRGAGFEDTGVELPPSGSRLSGRGFFHGGRRNHT